MRKNSIALAAALIVSLACGTAHAYDMTKLKGTYVQPVDIGVPYVKKLVLAHGENGKVKITATLCHVPGEITVTAFADAYIQRDVKTLKETRTGDRLVATFSSPMVSNLMEIDTGRRHVAEQPDWATVNVRCFLKYVDGACQYFDEVLDRTE